MQAIELVIVGSGPAGLSTALHLLQRDPGWSERMVLLEKEAHPRAKLCAGGITPFGLKTLETLGQPLSVPHVTIEEARMRYKKRVIRVRGRPTFVVTRRAEFDAWLAELARRRGARILENTPVQGLTRRRAGIAVHTEQQVFLAQAVVGADGSRGLVRPWALGHDRPPRVARTLEVVIPTTGQGTHFREHSADFDFSDTDQLLQGYTWDFPSLIAGEPHMNRGIYDARVDPAGRRARLPDLFGRRLQGLHRQKPMRYAGHPIRWFSPLKPISIEGVLLVGDAAGVDPLFGEGIAVALGYGRAAAASLDLAFRRRDYRFRDYRRRVLFSPLGRYLLMRWMMANLAYRLSHAEIFMGSLWRLGGLVMEVANRRLTAGDGQPGENKDPR